MQENTVKKFSRRNFLKIAATVGATVAVTGGTVSLFNNSQKGDILAKTWHLNPAFRIKTISNNEIDLFTQLKNGEKLQHRFVGLEADLFCNIDNEQDILSVIPALAEKYSQSEKECQKQVKQSLNDFMEANLIYFGDKIQVRYIEVPNG